MENDPARPPPPPLHMENSICFLQILFESFPYILSNAPFPLLYHKSLFSAFSLLELTVTSGLVDIFRHDKVSQEVRPVSQSVGLSRKSWKAQSHGNQKRKEARIPGELGKPRKGNKSNTWKLPQIVSVDLISIFLDIF